MDKAVREYMSNIGTTGGEAKTKAKVAAVRKNIKAAQAKRWPARKGKTK